VPRKQHAVRDARRAAAGGAHSPRPGRETALIVAPKDAQGLATAIRRLLDNAVLAARMGRAASEVAERRFSRDVMLERMEAVFQDVVDGNGSRAAP
jgi:glycosyltransferase involved in cell wall biosynthesis